MNHATDLSNKHCKKCEVGTAPLLQEEINERLLQIKGWTQFGQLIGKTFEFKNYYQTIAYVNAVAWLSHQEDHHPDLNVTYNKCHIQYSTHSINGLSDNDFICAAKVDALIVR